MEQKIIKHGDFTLEYISYCDSYFLYHKDFLFLECDLEYLFEAKLIDQIFKLEPDLKKAAGFITKLYNWGFGQRGALEKLLDNYEEYKQLNGIK